MKNKALVVGSLLLAVVGGALAFAEGPGSKQNAKPAGSCPMRVPGAKVSVVDIDSGVVIHVTGGDAATVARIQAAAAGLGGSSSAQSECKHCGGGAASQPQAAPSCTHGGACGDAKAAVYACPMGDYSGPMTKDGRCPKCGMALSSKK